MMMKTHTVMGVLVMLVALSGLLTGSGCARLTARAEPAAIRGGQESVITVLVEGPSGPMADADVEFLVGPADAGTLSSERMSTLPDGTAATVYRSAPAVADAEVIITARAAGQSTRTLVTVKPAAEFAAFAAEGGRAETPVVVVPTGSGAYWTYDIRLEPIDQPATVFSELAVTFPRQVEVVATSAWPDIAPIVKTPDQRRWSIRHPTPEGPRGEALGWTRVQLRVRADAPFGGLTRFQVRESGANGRSAELLAPGPR